MMSRLKPITSVLVLGIGTGLHAAVVEAPIDFTRDIRPILSANCFECHGPDAEARKARLRLDLHEGLIAPRRDGGLVIVPGNPGDSRLYQRISAEDPDDRMPPPDSRHDALEAAEIELIRRWIDEGAKWAQHWSFTPPQRSEPPQTSDTSWCRDPIDNFILARLHDEGLSPAPEATRETLLRRLSFDLTGLPPTIEEVDAFINDSDPGAYEQAIDRLLASPRFGERLAADWLDLARYADSYGYQSDVHRSVWPYRDWVIQAFNRNIPYDDFITWQLAGDLLPEPTHEQRLATAFNRLHRQTNEGGSVEEEFRVEYVADRVHTFGMAVLGMTTECARCHDHKFDPISQREYYELFAFFDNIDESGLYSHFTSAVPGPTLLLTTADATARIEEQRAQVEAAEAAILEFAETRRNAFAQWLETSETPLAISGIQGHYPLDAINNGQLRNTIDEAKPGGIYDGPRSVESPRGGAIQLSGDNNIHFPGVGVFSRIDPFTISLWIKTPELAERGVVIHRSRAWTDAGSQGYELLIKDGRLSWSLIHFWPGNAISIQAVEPLTEDAWTHVVVSHDGSARASGLEMYLDGRPAATNVVRDNLFKPITGGGPGNLTVGQRFRDRGFKNGSIDEVKVFARALTPIEAADLYDGTALDAERTANPEALFEYYLSNHDAPYQAERTALRALRNTLASTLNKTSEIMTMAEMDTPRSTFMLERGRYDARRGPVTPSTPSSIMPFPDDLPANRLGLARWVTDPKHPLTARVAVNRLWMLLYGRGIVATPEDFGSQGLTPSNPALLDALALDFIDSGWDIKAMLKRMASSATYRQQSGVPIEVRQRDPENELLARGPGHRLTAEMVRDQALSASGLLVDTIGGPSVHPYQPKGLWQDKSGKTYPQGTGAALYRRSLYTFWKRTSPPPAMMILDAAKRDVCIARRSSTSTPLQALLLLNDPQYIEASRVLAERAMTEGGPSNSERIAFAFRLLTSRHASEAELAILEQLLEQELEVFRTAAAAATSVASSGASAAREDLDTAEVAALAVVCSTILNSDAAVMRR